MEDEGVYSNGGLGGDFPPVRIQPKCQEQCLICDEYLVKREPVCVNDNHFLNSNHQRSLSGRLTLFCNLFGVRGPVKRWVSQAEDLRTFCEVCSGQVGLLLELRAKIEWLEKELEAGKEEVRRRIKVSEKGRSDEIGRDGGRRKEYRQIRSQILGRKQRLRVAKEVSSSHLKRKPIVLVPQVEREAADKARGVKVELLPIDNKGIEFNNDVWDDFSETLFVDTLLSVHEDVDPDFKPELPLRNKCSDKPVRKKGGRPRVRELADDGPKRKRGRPKKVRVEAPPIQIKRIRRKPGDEDDEFSPGEELGVSSEDEGNDDHINFREYKQYSTKKLGRYTLKNGVVTYKRITLTLCSEEEISLAVAPNGKIQEPHYRCGKCGEILRAVRIQKHVNTKHIFVKCLQCPDRKKISYSLFLSHMKQTHEPRERKECPICGKPGTISCNLKRHMWSHLSKAERQELLEKRGETLPKYARPEAGTFICDICGTTLTSSLGLKNHRIIHASQEEKEAAKKICPICGKAVVELKPHLDGFHATEKKFRCSHPNCDKAFARRISLRLHLESVHEEKKRFECSLCTKTFSKRPHLESHMNGHLGLRPFTCDYCEMACTSKALLSKHTKKFHVEGCNPKRKSYIRGPDKKKRMEPGKSQQTV